LRRTSESVISSRERRRRLRETREARLLEGGVRGVSRRRPGESSSLKRV
jgi:hypothetical protein